MNHVYVLYVNTASGDIHLYVFATPPDKPRIEAFLRQNLPDEYKEGYEPPYYHVTREPVLY